MSDPKGVPPEFFDTAYAGSPRWEIDRPQEDVVRLFGRDGFKGNVLDLGCGTGENALFLAGKGLNVLGVDRVPDAIDRARAKAARLKSKAAFEVGDALDLPALGRKFDTILDSGCFHVFSDKDRARYLKSVAAVVPPRGTLHILCFSDAEPGTDGPRRIAERELIETFNMRGWLVEEVAEARYETTMHPEGARAWLASFVRYGE